VGCTGHKHLQITLFHSGRTFPTYHPVPPYAKALPNKFPSVAPVTVTSSITSSSIIQAANDTSETMTVSGILINCAATAFFLGQVSARACSIHTHLDGSEDVLGLLGSDAPQIAMGDGRLHKRWSRAPCNSDQWTRFLAAGCTLTTLISVDDAAAGAMFSPPQAEAASKWKNFPGRSYAPCLSPESY